MSADLAGRIADFLDAHQVMSLATAGPDGPHAASLFYARDGMTLAWVSDPASRHSRDLAALPRVAATVAPDYADYAAIRGVQISGTAEAVAELAARARLLALFARRFSFLSPGGASAMVHAAFSRATVYRLTPVRIVLIDNTLGFGHKETLLLP
jgi:uncharacterized protein